MAKATYRPRQQLILNLIYYLNHEFTIPSRNWIGRPYNPLTVFDAVPDDIEESPEKYKLPFVVIDFFDAESNDFELGNQRQSVTFRRGYTVNILSGSRSDKLMLADEMENVILKTWKVYDLNQFEFVSGRTPHYVDDGVGGFCITEDNTPVTSGGIILPELYTAFPENFTMTTVYEEEGVKRFHDMASFDIVTFEKII